MAGKYKPGSKNSDALLVIVILAVGIYIFKTYKKKSVLETTRVVVLPENKITSKNPSTPAESNVNTPTFNTAGNPESPKSLESSAAPHATAQTPHEAETNPRSSTTAQSLQNSKDSQNSQHYSQGLREANQPQNRPLFPNFQKGIDLSKTNILKAPIFGNGPPKGVDTSLKLGNPIFDSVKEKISSQAVKFPPANINTIPVGQSTH